MFVALWHKAYYVLTVKVMSRLAERVVMIKKQLVLFFSIFVLIAALFLLAPIRPAPAQADKICEGEFVSVSEPLNDLGSGEYVRMEEGATGYTGGLYPGGGNSRPADHETAGLAVAAQIQPLNQDGDPAAGGRIVMISVGMSNAAFEFAEFAKLADNDAERNPSLRVINGAQPGKVTIYWRDPQAATWDYVDEQVISAGLSPAQVQVAWVKNVRGGGGEFPEKQQDIQSDLAIIARNLKIRYPNIKIAYFSTRTRSYKYWTGISPEPVAFESGFAVKWLIEQQIEGDPALNFDPAAGPVVAPFLSWGPYLWIDGENERSDGLVWLQEDLQKDCTHPSELGVDKVAKQLMNFFKSDSTARVWFLAAAGPSLTERVYLPSFNGSGAPVQGQLRCR